MNSESVREKRVFPYVLAALGAFVIVAGLVWVMQRYGKPAPLGEDRIALRTKALAELRAAEGEALNAPAWIDQTKGLVRLPVTNAMALFLQEWQNPAAARSNLIARVEKATAVPPKAPQKPSEFE
jgi:hypothetical protein